MPKEVAPKKHRNSQIMNKTEQIKNHRKLMLAATDVDLKLYDPESGINIDSPIKVQFDEIGGNFNALNMTAEQLQNVKCLEQPSIFQQPLPDVMSGGTHQ